MMANEPEEPILPELDEYDTAAVVGLLIRVMRIDNANTRDRAILDELNAALAERAPFRKKYVEAVGAFGFDVKSDGLWKRVKAAIGPETYSRAWAIATAVPHEDKDAAHAGAAKIVQSESEQSRFKPDGEHHEKSDQQTPKISQAILAYLRSLQGLGAPVSVIKKHLMDAYAIETHEKTPGMTLYRLSKEGLVRRDGRSWFATDAASKLETAKLSSTDRGVENGD